MATEPNRLLRAARERLPSPCMPGEPMSRAELADAVNCWLWHHTGRRFALDDHAVARWERGQVRRPGREYRAALRALTGTDDGGLGFPPGRRTTTAANTAASSDVAAHHPGLDATTDGNEPRPPTVSDTEGMDRRELLRLFTVTGAALALPPLDTDRMLSGHPVDPTMVDDFERLNAHLWQVSALTAQKRTLLPLLREQLGVLSGHLNRTPAPHRERVCGLVADLYQLVGETFFDGDHYTDAAHCYLLSTQAAREAKSPDLWAAALTRHSFIDLYTRNHANALPLLDLAERIAHRGNPYAATRFWVTAVRAETHAALRNNYACEKDLACAAEVAHLDPATATNGGWLRFNGDRLPEQTGGCMITLGRLNTAETALAAAMTNAKTPRRRATVNADLAVIAAHQRDPARAAAHLQEAITTAHATRSGYLAKKLETTRPELAPLANDPRIRAVTAEITDLGRVLYTATTH